MMRMLTSQQRLLLAAMLVTWISLAGAQSEPAADSASERAAYARLPVCTLSADGQHLAEQPCRTAPARVPMPRRPVAQIVEPLPAMRLAPSPASPTLAPPATGAPPVIASPVITPRALNNCTASGCNDAVGGRLNNAAPGMVITPQGQVCSRNGVWIQC